VLEEGALGAAGGGAGGGGVADGGGERGGVALDLEIAAMRAIGVAGRDVGEGLGLEPVGADLLPHRGGDGGDQLLLGGVDGAVAVHQVQQVPGPLLGVLLGQEDELAGAQAVLGGVHGGAGLALRRVGATLLWDGEGGGFGHGGVSGRWGGCGP
jgi:hypothetical protein